MAKVSGTVVLVNRDKEVRALEIINLILGKKRPGSEEETERKEKFTLILAEGEIDPKSEGALQFVYEKLGGLVRTEGEQKEFETKVAKESKKKVTR